MSNQLVYVPGTGGLGNVLFQIATASHYSKNYNYKIVLLDNQATNYGTSNWYGTNKSHNNTPYKETIFSKIKFCEHKEGKTTKIFNKYLQTGTKKIKPDEKTGNILIEGWSQNLSLFDYDFNEIYKHLDFNNESIKQYIYNKYGNISNGICISIRKRKDFARMNKIRSKSYINALETLRNMHIDINNLYIISDIDDAWENIFKLNEKYPAINVNESDMIQFYIGLMCKHYILCESTFHLWIAYLGTLNNSDKTTIYFNNSFVDKKSLKLKSWIGVDYS